MRIIHKKTIFLVLNCRLFLYFLTNFHSHLEQELELSDKDEENELERKRRIRSNKKRISDEMIKDFQLGTDDHTTDGNNSDQNNNDWKDDRDYKEHDHSKNLENAIYNLGNYCPSMLRGVQCTWKECPWIHYMQPEDAVSQFYRIFANLPLYATIQFYRYFTNLEIQEQLVLDAQEKLTEPIGVCSKEVCREVLRAMVRLCGGMDLSLTKIMEMVDISTGVCDVQTGKDILVTIFTEALAMLKHSGGKEAQVSSRRLVKWAWTHLYLTSVSKGVILPSEFYIDLTELLSTHNMTSQLVEVLLYTSLMPSLKPPVRGVADVLTSPPSSLTSPHSTAVFTGQVLSRLSSQDWISLHQMADILPGLSTLVTCLLQDDPADVYKFYESLPEMEGLEVPEVTPPPQSDTNIWLRNQLVQGHWVNIAEYFCSFQSKDVEMLSDFIEKLLLEISQLCGEFQLQEPVHVVFKTGTEIVVSKQSEIHKQFWSQLGVSLVVCEVTSSQWVSASKIIKTMSNDLEVNWTGIKPPGICQFADIDRGMVPLFVLETLVRTKQCQDIVKHLKLWDCLSYLESDLSRGKRDIILLSVLECLAVTNVDMETLDIIIRTNEVMAASMKQETDVMVRRRHEVMSNVTFMLMLNENLPGARLYKRYAEVRGCSHELEKAVIRGLVTLLAHPRNNMIQEAMSVYISGVRWGVYSSQHVRRPLTLKLSSILTMEELGIIVNEFFMKIKKLKNVEDSFNIYVKIEEISVPNCGVRLLNSIG